MKLTTAAFAFALIAAPALAQDAPTGNAEAGAKVFNKCQTCHVVANEAGEVLAGKNSKTGPNLYGMPGALREPTRTSSTASRSSPLAPPASPGTRPTS